MTTDPIETVPEQESTPEQTDGEQLAAEQAAEVKYTMSPSLVPFLMAQNISIAVSSYQSGRLYLIGCNPQGGLMVNEHIFQQAMGICVDGNSLYLATMFQILRMENVLAKGEQVNHTFDACFVPRTAHVTSALDAHDVGVTGDGEIVFVNTRYNCLSTISPVHSFKPIWKPSFISKIVNEDRCHLNGLAMHGGKPAYVTAVSKSDTIDGWRDRRRNGGIVIDIEKNRTICEGLSMPHSPKVHRDRLWLLNAGTGELGWVEPAPEKSDDTGKSTGKGKFHPLVFCPGFLRGLSFHDKYAFVGLSKPRYERFEGLALDDRLREADSEPWCGVQIIDLETGTCVHWFRIDGATAELYDVAVVPGVACAMSLGFATEEILNFVTHDDLNE